MPGEAEAKIPASETMCWDKGEGSPGHLIFSLPFILYQLPARTTSC